MGHMHFVTSKANPKGYVVFHEGDPSKGYCCIGTNEVVSFVIMDPMIEPNRQASLQEFL